MSSCLNLTKDVGQVSPGQTANLLKVRPVGVPLTWPTFKLAREEFASNVLVYCHTTERPIPPNIVAFVRFPQHPYVGHASVGYLERQFSGAIDKLGC